MVNRLKIGTSMCQPKSQKEPSKYKILLSVCSRSFVSSSTTETTVYFCFPLSICRRNCRMFQNIVLEKQISFQSRIKLNWLSPARFFKILRYFQTEILIFEAKFEIKIFYFFSLLLLVVTSECNPKLQFIIMPQMYCGDSHDPTKCENQATL